MKRLVSAFLILGFSYLAYGVYVSFWNPALLPAHISSPANNHYYDYAGVINVHTNKSSGSGDFDTVLAAAKYANLNFIVISDLNDFSPDISRQSYYNDVLVYIGGEYSYLDARILNFDFHKQEHLHGPGRSQMVFADILSHANRDRTEGLFFLLHPLRPGYKLNTPIPEGMDGLELLNLKNVWQENWLNSKPSFFWTLLLYPFNSDLAFVRLLMNSNQKEIELWDKTNLSRPTVGFFGAAAEARLRLPKEMIVKFPSYETLFSLVKNHVLIRSELTGHAEQDRKKISTALRRGQFYMSLDLLQNPKGFETYVEDANSNLYPLGSQIPLRPQMKLVVKLPQKPELPFETVIYKDGERVLVSNSAETHYFIHEPGGYRSAVRVKIPLPWPHRARWINWIVTNPIYID